MKKQVKTTLSLILVIHFILYGFISNEKNYIENTPPVVQQVTLDPNNIKSYFASNGVFNQNISLNGSGFEWPRGTGKHAISTTGLNIGALINNNFRMAAAWYGGEYLPGHCINGIFFTDTTFKLYKVSRSDNMNTNPDWLNWGLMVPYGAPYTDVNNNGTYEPAIDTPGVRNAEQTIFGCLTDANPSSHSLNVGFGGGTLPVYAEVHLTAWAYNNPGLVQDMQFLKFIIINKGTLPWNSTYFSIVADPDLGYPDDDYIGCDTVRQLGYCYNGDNDDGTSQGYGINPPAVGFTWLNCANNMGMKSFNYFSSTSQGGPICERDPNGLPDTAYKFMKGIKRDNTPWVVPVTNPPQTTKFCYSGDPETGNGWNEGQPGSPSGSVRNCGSLTGTIIPVNTPHDRRLVLNSGSDNFTMNPNDTQTIIIAQLIARGTSNLNSVTLLKQRADLAQQICSSGFIIGINPISTEIPNKFTLYQNYPNPFNPTTKIKFDISESNVKSETSNAKLMIYNSLGEEIITLVNESLKPGIYEIEWPKGSDASNYPSGVYYYQLKADNFTETKKMVLLK